MNRTSTLRLLAVLAWAASACDDSASSTDDATGGAAGQAAGGQGGAGLSGSSGQSAGGGAGKAGAGGQPGGGAGQGGKAGQGGAGQGGASGAGLSGSSGHSGKAGSGGGAAGGGAGGAAGSEGVAGSGAGTAGGGGAGGGDGVDDPPTLTVPGTQKVGEDEVLTVALAASDPDGDPVRVFVAGLPPGAVWDEAARTITFRPDFIQGGRSWQVAVTARSTTHEVTQSFAIEADDTIQPPWPAIKSDTAQAGGKQRKVVLSQTTDDYLGSPGNTTDSFNANVLVPTDATADDRRPVRIFLHGFGGDAGSDGGTGEFHIHPGDPKNTYWWGYATALPDGKPTSGPVPPYTARRVLHLVEWVLKNYPGADPERVYVHGGSMGGAGASTLGLLWARHFCYARTSIGQFVPANHRPSRLKQLATLWGTVEAALPAEPGGPSLWEHTDLTRVLLEVPGAREQFISTKHGKDDPTIHFGAVVLPSPLTKRSYYRTVQEEHIGHYAVWDEGGHGSPDPLLKAGWWDNGFNLIHDKTTFLRRDLAFPAFSGSSHDRDPGDGGPNGKVAKFSAEKGYAADEAKAGDTGWNGQIAGALNRFLRWDSAGIVDTRDTFTVRLRLAQGDGKAAPEPGYPTYPNTGDRLDGEPPVTVDVTPRRVQAFRLLPGEKVAWAYGEASGTATANARGEVTVPQLPVTKDWTALTLTRSP